METSIIAQEFQRFFSLLFSGKAFCCLLLTNQGEKIILKNAVAPLQPEQKIWLSRLNFDQKRLAIIDENNPLHLKTDGNCGVFNQKHTNFELYLILSEENLGVIPYLQNLISDRYTQLEQRIAASELITRYQNSLTSLEQEKSEMIKERQRLLQNRIELWKSLLNTAVEIESSVLEGNETLQYQDEFMDQLSRAFELQQFLHPGMSTILITKEMLPEIRSTEVATVKQTGWNRASLLLDKYEEAASLVSQTGLTINGKTIAQFLVPSISPPAITDALKKNRKGIHAMLRENPGKWPLLRKNLKQVRELHESTNYFTIN